MTYYATQKLYSTKIKIATFSAESLLPEERVALSMHYSLKPAKQSWIFFNYVWLTGGKGQASLLCMT